MMRELGIYLASVCFSATMAKEIIKAMSSLVYRNFTKQVVKQQRTMLHIDAVMLCQCSDRAVVSVVVTSHVFYTGELTSAIYSKTCHFPIP